MTASQLARQLHGKRSGRRWMCRCPTGLHAHGDINRSLSVWDSEDGWVCLKCFTGCSRCEILAALGLKIRDMARDEFKSNPEWEQKCKDEKLLNMYKRQHGLAIMAQAVSPNDRNYWRGVERRIAVKGRSLTDKMFPSKADSRIRNERVQEIISEYGFDELWNCIPEENV